MYGTSDAIRKGRFYSVNLVVYLNRNKQLTLTSLGMSKRFQTDQNRQRSDHLIYRYTTRGGGDVRNPEVRPVITSLKINNITRPYHLRQGL